MPGGLMQLSAYGSENHYLNGNPQMTFFKVVYKRYTNFSMETIEIGLRGPNELAYESPIKLKSKISRNGDLIANMYFKFRLPCIKSSSEKEFYWCRGVGLSIIDYVDLYIGGSKIERLDGKYIDIDHHLTHSYDKKKSFNKLVGIDDYLTYTRQTNEEYYRGYHTNPQNISNICPTQPNAPHPSNINKFHNSPCSIFDKNFCIPLNFWFSKHLGLSIPLIALQYHDVEIEIQLKPLRDLYTILKPIKKYYYYNNNSHLDYSSIPNSYTLNPSLSRTTASTNNHLSSFMSYQRIKPRPLASSEGKTDHISQFIYNKFINQTFDFRPELDVNYIFLDIDERRNFAEITHEYLITQPHKIIKQGLQSTNIIDFEAFHPCKEIIYVAYRSDNDVRNEWLNYSTHTNQIIKYEDEMFSWQDAWWQNSVNTSNQTPITFTHNTDGSIICDRFQELIFRFGPYGEASYPIDLVTNNPISPQPNSNQTILGFTVNIKDTLYSLNSIIKFRNIWIFTLPSEIPLITELNYKEFELSPLIKNKIKFNGYSRQDYRNNEFYQYIQPYQYHTSTTNQPIYVYSFSVDPEKYQPSGACNFSRIQSLEFDIELKQTPINNNQISGINTITRKYNFDMDFYFINYNILKIMGGMGGLVFGN